MTSERAVEPRTFAAATAIIEDLALLVEGEDDSQPLLDKLPVELGDRIAAFLNAPATPAPRESGWEELRREIEALPQIDSVRLDSVAMRREIEPSTLLVRAAVLAIVDHLAAARGEPPEPGLDVERLARAMQREYKYLGRMPDIQSNDDFDRYAAAVVRSFNRLATPTTPEPDPETATGEGTA